MSRREKANLPDLAVNPDPRPGMEWNDEIVHADEPYLRVAFMSNTGEENARAAFIVACVNYVRAALRKAGGEA